MLDFEKQKTYFFNHLFDTHYVFEVTKECGYSQWVTIYKNDPFSTLYDVIKREFAYIDDSSKPLQFYITKKEDMDSKIYLKKQKDMTEEERTDETVRDFIMKNHEYFTSIYPVPAKVVYRIWLDDGCSHADHSHN